MGNKQTWFVGVNEEGQADTTQKPLRGAFLFAFGPWPWKTAQKWARAWNQHKAEHTLIMCEPCKAVCQMRGAGCETCEEWVLLNYDEDDENWKATHPHGEFSVY